MKAIITAIAAASVLAGCASTGSIAPQYINPSVYQNQDCQSLQSEINRVSAAVERTQKQNIGLSSTGIGIGLAGGRGGIYPTVSLGMGTGNSQRQAKNNTLSQLYGQHDAMVMAARKQGCGFVQGMKVFGE